MLLGTRNTYLQVDGLNVVDLTEQIYPANAAGDPMDGAGVGVTEIPQPNMGIQMHDLMITLSAILLSPQRLQVWCRVRPCPSNSFCLESWSDCYDYSY
jgi:hypothetical protein